jgi:cytochrome b6-f complex iron-sulfur subunit
MSDEAQGGAPKKLSTQEILARARAEKARRAEAAAPAPVQAQPAAAEAPPAAASGPASSPAAAPKEKPKSTAEILAAARAQKGQAAASSASSTAAAPAAAAAPSAAAAEAPAAPAASAAAAGPKLSVEEMLAAVRPVTVPSDGALAAAPAKPARPVAPPMPAKPVAKKPASAEAPTRRNLLWALVATPFALAWTLLAGVTAIWTLGMARFMLPNVLTEPPRKFKIGPPSDYDLGTVATKWVAQYGIWVVHTDQYKGRNSIYALASVCTHLGCTPSWLEGEQKFKCPCHGSGFYITGINFEGPAPRPLERVGIRLAEDGMLEVDKSVKFQEEMGQWNDSNSYYEVPA